MSAPLNLANSSACCAPSCSDAAIAQIPGPKGDPAEPCEPCVDGINAYTLTAANFAVPAVSASVSVAVVESGWAALGQIVFVGIAGYMQVSGIADSTHLTLTNLGYPGNAAPTTVIAFPQTISPGGLRGPTGPADPSTFDDLSPTTTKGDLIIDDGAMSPDAHDVRFGVGFNGSVFHADSAQPVGERWSPIDLTGSATLLGGNLPIAHGGTNASTAQAAIDNLAAAAIRGDLLHYDGTHWTHFPIGTALQQLRTNGAATDVEWFTPPSPSGITVQMLSTSTNTFTTYASVIPWDDTIPQNTEGTQLLAINITPSNAANRFLVEAFVPCGVDQPAVPPFTAVILSLFDSGVNAIAAVASTAPQDDQDLQNEVTLTHEYIPGDILPHTLALRIGTSNGNTVGVNGLFGARRLGGIQRAWLRVTEFTP